MRAPIGLVVLRSTTFSSFGLFVRATAADFQAMLDHAQPKVLLHATGRRDTYGMVIDGLHVLCKAEPGSIHAPVGVLVQPVKRLSAAAW